MNPIPFLDIGAQNALLAEELGRALAPAAIRTVAERATVRKRLLTRVASLLLRRCRGGTRQFYVTLLSQEPKITGIVELRLARFFFGQRHNLIQVPFAVRPIERQRRMLHPRAVRVAFALIRCDIVQR